MCSLLLQLWHGFWCQMGCSEFFRNTQQSRVYSEEFKKQWRSYGPVNGNTLRVLVKITRLLWADSKARVTNIITLYNHDEQKSNHSAITKHQPWGACATLAEQESEALMGTDLSSRTTVNRTDVNCPLSLMLCPWEPQIPVRNWHDSKNKEAFCCCSSSTSRFDTACILRCFSAHQKWKDLSYHRRPVSLEQAAHLISLINQVFNPADPLLKGWVFYFLFFTPFCVNPRDCYV